MPIWFLFVLVFELGVLTGVVISCIEQPLIVTGYWYRANGTYKGR
jgi:hypothetical protein